MALTFPANFTSRVNTNSEDRVVFAHLYYNDNADYLPVATTPVVIGGVQYLGCLRGYSNIGETWNVGGDNLVTKAAPTIEISEYSDPVGYSLIAEMDSKSFFGNNVEIYEGFDGLALVDCVKIFTGKIDQSRLTGSNILFECSTEGYPETVISGGKIDAQSSRIEGRAISSIVLNEKVDGKLLPIHFGKHWCAAGLCYEITDTGVIRFLFNDPYWCGITSTLNSDATPQHATGQTGTRELFRFNLNRNKKRVLVKLGDRLAPIFETGYDGTPIFEAIGSDSRINYESINADYISFYAPADSAQCLEDDAVLAECPIRPVKSASEVLTGTGASQTNTPADAFDGDATTYMNLSGTSGAIECEIPVRLCEWEQLCHDDNSIIHKGRMISTPVEALQSEPDLGYWSTLVLGRFGVVNADTNIYATIDRGSLIPGIGVTKAGRSNGDDYNFASLLLERNTDGSWNILDLSTDVPASDWQGILTYGVGDGGNFSAPESAGELPYLGRKFFDRVLLEDIAAYITFVASKTSSPSGRFYDVSLHVFGKVDIETDGYVYTDYLGFRMPTVETNLLSRFEGDTGTKMLENPVQYIETILRARLGFTNFNTTEWTYASDWFDDFFNSWRKESGFQILDTLKFSDFIKDYLKHEPFTVFQDSSGQWRLKKQYRTLADIESEETLYTIDYNDCDDFNIELTDMERLCLEIKKLHTDYIPALDDYAVKRSWLATGIDYDYWKQGNLFLSNDFFKDAIECKYTSSPVCDRVKLDSVSYGCVKTHTNVSPDTETTLRTMNHWMPLCEDLGAGTTWSNATTYRGEDCENRAIADAYINMHANRARKITVKSSNVKYKKHEIGDYVVFDNVPDTLLGQVLKGFAGEEDDESITVNGQAAYYVFMIVDIRKSMTDTKIVCEQCKDLSAVAITNYTYA